MTQQDKQNVEEQDFMFEDYGSKMKECMGILCPHEYEKKRQCKWHKAWDGKCQVGVFFGASDCKYFQEE